MRPVTEISLNRITKGIEKNGYATICFKPDSNSEIIYDETAELRGIIRQIHCSYLYVYYLSKEAPDCKTAAAKLLVIFPFDISKNVSMKFTVFKRTLIKSLISFSKNNMRKWNLTFFYPGRSNLLLSLQDPANLYDCYIETPPPSMQSGHMRWASGDLNHIYKEL